MPKRTLQGFQLRVSRFQYSAKWKARSWKASEVDQSALEKTPRFSTPNFRFWVLCKIETGNENLGKLILQGFPVFRELRVSTSSKDSEGLSNVQEDFIKLRDD